MLDRAKTFFFKWFQCLDIAFLVLKAPKELSARGTALFSLPQGTRPNAATVMPMWQTKARVQNESHPGWGRSEALFCFLCLLSFSLSALIHGPLYHQRGPPARDLHLLNSHEAISENTPKDTAHHTGANHIVQCQSPVKINRFRTCSTILKTPHVWKEQMWQFSSFNSLFRDTPPYTFPGSPIVFHY